MADDESQNNKAPGSREGKAPLQLGQNRLKHWKIINIKPKDLAKAETLFFQYCYPDLWFWKYPEWKQAALDILRSELIEGDELKSPAKGQNYPLIQGDSNVLGDLILDLVHEHFEYDVNKFLPLGRSFHRLEGSLQKEIVDDFDEYFRYVAAIAQLGGVRKDEIQRKWDGWREKVSARAVKGEIPHHWRLLVMDKINPGKGYAPKLKPQQIARKFADVFLRHVPQASANQIAIWVNGTLESLGRKTVDNSILRTYLSKEKHRKAQLP